MNTDTPDQKPASDAADPSPKPISALQAIYDRRQPPVPWVDGENLPWDDPEFSERMLREHLDQTHAAASRRLPEIRALVERMMEWLSLAPGSRLLDVTCGPGLYAAEFARRGVHVTGIDFSPASLRYARTHCQGLPCDFVQADVREMDFAGRNFDAAIYIYGQPTVLKPDEMGDVFRRIRAALKPGAQLLLEILDYERFDKRNSNWWYTDEGGLWGDFPYLHLGERAWDAEQQASVERFYVINLETGEMRTYGLTDQAYRPEQMIAILAEAGFGDVAVRPGREGAATKDADEWVVYVATTR